MAFCGWLWWYLNARFGRELADAKAIEYLTGYLIEKSLAVDNVFVWITLIQLLRGTHGVPEASAAVRCGRRHRYARRTNTNRVLLRDRQLPAEFFELQTGFAGEFIQKLVNYQITVACVFEESRSFGDRFREYVAEAKLGRQFRSFSDEREAIAWLEEQ